MQAILTRYHGPTNVKGSRISARYAGGSIVRGYDHALNLNQNHEAVARELAAKLDWLDHFTLASGGLPSGDWAHVLVRK